MALATKLHYCDGNFPRVSYRRDPASGVWLPGHYLEPAATQLARYTRALDNLSPTRCSVPTTNALAPDGTLTADVLHEDGSGTTHYVVDPSGRDLSGAYVFSAHASPINRDFIRLEDSANGAGVIFDVANGVVGSVVNTGTISGGSGSIEPSKFSNGMYRVIWRFTSSGGWFYPRIGIASSLSVYNFNGLDQDSLCVWGYDIKTGRFPSSHIINDGTGTVTRTADSDGVWAHGFLVDQATMLFAVIIPEHTPTSTLGLCAMRSADGNNYLVACTQNASGYLELRFRTGGGSVLDYTHTVNVCDGKLHWIAASIKSGTLASWIDGAGKHHTGFNSAFSGPLFDEFRLYSAVGGWVGAIHTWPEFFDHMPQPEQPGLFRE